MSLLCCESECECRTYPDEVLLSDDRVLHNMLKIEERYCPNSSYFDCVQKEITADMRKTVAEWMLEVCEAEKCEQDVFPLAMNYLDRFLSICQIKKSQLQLLGSTCLLLSSKIRATKPLHPSRLVYYTDNSITREDLWAGKKIETTHLKNEDIEMFRPLQQLNASSVDNQSVIVLVKGETSGMYSSNQMWELLVLTNLKWDISSVTAQDFISHILRKIPVDQSSCNCQMLVKHTQTFIALCATDFKFSIYTPSIIASASIAASLQGLDWTNKNNCPLPELLSRIHRITGIEREYLQSCIDQIEETVREAMAHRGPGNDLTENPETTNSLNSSNSNSHFFSDKIADHGKAETPTDVRDVHF